MEGPDEFADGLSHGAQSLLGHVVGGTAGSVSLISSSLGNLLTSLSFDEDYKKVSSGPPVAASCLFTILLDSTNVVNTLTALISAAFSTSTAGLFCNE
jgi:Leucine-rich repeat (LRR) protein